jgi:hypothetical protein
MQKNCRQGEQFQAGHDFSMPWIVPFGEVCPKHTWHIVNVAAGGFQEFVRKIKASTRLKTA